MAALLTNVIQEVTSYASLISSTAASFFHLITSLGKILFDVVCFFGSLLLTSLNLLFNGLTVVAEFTLFLCDTGSTLCEIWFMIGEGGQSALDAVGGIPLFFKSCIVEVFSAVFSVFATLGDLSLLIVKIVKESVILAGNGSLFLLQLVPLTLISLFTSVKLFVEWTSNASLDAISSFTKETSSFFRRLLQELSDIPPSSVIGLVLVFVLTALLRFILRSLEVHSKWDRLKSKIRNFQWPRLWPAEQRHPDDSLGSSPEPGLARSPAETSHSRTNLLKQLEREREGKLCVVCQDQEKCIILLPCRHFCLCNVCLETLAVDYAACPICRRPVVDHLRIFG